MLAWRGTPIAAVGAMTSDKPKNGNSYKPPVDLEPMASARAAGLRYVSDDSPGIARRRIGKAFRYLHADGSTVRDRATLGRIRALAIPPAWTDVWICERDDGHVQATGRDARGRKQYRYHRRWREVRDDTKYGRMVAFAKALPRIRRRVRRDLALPGLPREKVLATIVRLLERTRIRVGNEEYARENDSFGLTTLRERQVKVRGAKLNFRFRGKSGVQHDIELTDPRLATIVRRMQDLPGQELFQYVDENGETRGIESADVNAYLKDIAEDDFTSKDFRTWAGTVLAARALQALAPFESVAEGKRNVVQAIEAVAKKLGNTKAVCRKCYVHPAILDTYLEGRLAHYLERRREEAAVIALLQARLRREASEARRSGAGGRSLAPVLARSLAAAARRLHRGERSSSQPASRGTP
jgi:DNA topoisomerase I